MGTERYLMQFCIGHFSVSTVKPALRGHSKRGPKTGFQDRLSLYAGHKYGRMLQGEHSAILSTFIKVKNHTFFSNALIYMSLRPLFCLYLSGRLRQVLLYL